MTDTQKHLAGKTLFITGASRGIAWRSRCAPRAALWWWMCAMKSR